MTFTTISTHTVLDATDDCVGDDELEQVIREVYVGGGFTDHDVAAKFFTAAAIRQRGRLLMVRDPADGVLLGTSSMAPTAARSPFGPPTPTASPRSMRTTSTSTSW